MPRTSQPLRIERDGAQATILWDGATLLDGTATGDLLVFRFADGSGIRAPFPIVGHDSPDGFFLAGEGPVYFGEMHLNYTRVEVKPSGVIVGVPLRWADRIIRAHFELGKKHGSWRGAIYTQDMLHCEITKPEVLRTSIIMEIAGGVLPNCTALTVLDSRSIKIPVAGTLQELFESGFAGLRGLILRAVTDWLLKELSAHELTYAKAQRDWPTDYFAPLALDRVCGHDAAPSFEPQRRGRVDVEGMNVHGYLPDVSPSVSRHRSTVSAPIPAGYLPGARSLFQHGAQGYVTPPLMQMPKAPSIPVGYLSGRNSLSASRFKGYLPTGRNMPLMAQEPPAAGSVGDLETTTLSDPATAQLAALRYAEMERSGYSIIRCKDLIHAIEGAAVGDDEAG